MTEGTAMAPWNGPNKINAQSNLAADLLIMRREQSYWQMYNGWTCIHADINKKHLKNVGPIRYCEPPLHCQSPGVASRTPAIAIAQAACDVHDIDDDNDNA